MVSDIEKTLLEDTFKHKYYVWVWLEHVFDICIRKIKRTSYDACVWECPSLPFLPWIFRRCAKITNIII